MRHTSTPPVPSSTWRSRRYIPDQHFDGELSTIRDNYNDRGDDNSESDDQPVRWVSKKAMGMHPSRDSFMSTLGKQVAVTQLTPTLVQPLHPQCWEFNIVLEEEDEREPAQLASKKVSN